jgi:hypothetical protein
MGAVAFVLGLLLSIALTFSLTSNRAWAQEAAADPSADPSATEATPGTDAASDAPTGAETSGDAPVPLTLTIDPAALGLPGGDIPAPEQMEVVDLPVDDGSGLLLSFVIPEADDNTAVVAQVRHTDGNWYDAGSIDKYATLQTEADHPEWYKPSEASGDKKVLQVAGFTVPGPEGSSEDVALAPGQSYPLRLVVYRDLLDPALGSAEFEAGSGSPTEQWFNTNKVNEVAIGIVMSLIILGAIFAARRNPNLFIRRINGLEAVDEAIGRATEMGRPVLQVNGLDPLTTPSTVAAVNILGRIARRVAAFDSQLLVPSFDPVVMTVSQETVRQAYAEAGRPDAYREDSIFFVTDQQFSYVASVCGIMLREKPAANFFLGYFYAEALLLAETGASTGAIQIAGTDAQAQLPFFITTCDYTLIGEEIYAASAYLSREPMLLGSLKGLDVLKAILMVLLLLGTLLATFESTGLVNFFTPK